METEQKDFLIKWAKTCNLKKDTKIHCSLIDRDDEPMTLNFWSTKMMIESYDKESWFNFIGELINNGVIYAFNQSSSSLPRMIGIDYYFTSQTEIDKVISNAI